jgi:taurine dioxygenase
MKITRNTTGLGARIEGIDLSQPLSRGDFAAIFRALGEHSVICFPKQSLSAPALKAFSERFGGLQGSPTGTYCDPDVPEVMLLSNIVENGKPIGLADAGQDWHTDMSYNDVIGFTNVLYAIEVPRRDGKPLGNTEFADMQAAYEDLPAEMKSKLSNLTATHDFNKFWEEMRKRPGSTRPPLTPAQRAARPRSVHPIFLTHPITGRKVLYANPGYAVRINELSQEESDKILEQLFRHQLQPKYQYAHVWTEGDVLMWDHIGTLHNAIPDYRADEHRLIKRCQVLADRVFDPAFVREAMGAAEPKTSREPAFH